MLMSRSSCSASIRAVRVQHAQIVQITQSTSSAASSAGSEILPRSDALLVTNDTGTCGTGSASVLRRWKPSWHRGQDALLSGTDALMMTAASSAAVD